MSRTAILSLAALAALIPSGCGSQQRRQVQIQDRGSSPRGLTHQHWLSVQPWSRTAAAADLKGARAFRSRSSGTRRARKATRRSRSPSSTACPIEASTAWPWPRRTRKAWSTPSSAWSKRRSPSSSSTPDSTTRKRKANPNLFIKYVATDNYHGGKMAADKLLDILEKDGKKEMKVALFRYQPGSESTEQRRASRFLDPPGIAQPQKKERPRDGRVKGEVRRKQRSRRPRRKRDRGWINSRRPVSTVCSRSTSRRRMVCSTPCGEQKWSARTERGRAR